MAARGAASPVRRPARASRGTRAGGGSLLARRERCPESTASCSRAGIAPALLAEREAGGAARRRVRVLASARRCGDGGAGGNGRRRATALFAAASASAAVAARAAAVAPRAAHSLAADDASACPRRQDEGHTRRWRGRRRGGRPGQPAPPATGRRQPTARRRWRARSPAVRRSTAGPNRDRSARQTRRSIPPEAVRHVKPLPVADQAQIPAAAARAADVGRQRAPGCGGLPSAVQGSPAPRSTRFSRWPRASHSAPRRRLAPARRAAPSALVMKW